MASATVTTLHPAIDSESTIESASGASAHHADMINAVTVSPSLMVLVVKPLVERFKADRDTCARKAGFKHAPVHVGLNTMALMDRDLGEPLAVMKVNGYAETVGQLTAVEIHIDPELCPIEWNAGSRLMAACTKFAELMEGRLCNGLGNEIGEEACEAIAQHIDHVMSKRIVADREKRTVELPTGERRELSELSFCYTVLREAGSRKRTYRPVYFDADPMPCYAGRAKGMEMAGEVVAFFRKHQVERLHIENMLREVFERSGSQGASFDSPEVANVADGFMEVMTALIMVGSRHLNPAWLDEKIAQSKDYHENWQRDREDRKVVFVERMRKAREAKKAA